MRRTSVVLGALLVLLALSPGTSAARAQTPDVPAACVAMPAPESEGNHQVYLEAWRVERGRTVPEPSGPRRDLLTFLLQEVGSRLVPPSRLEISLGPSTVFHTHEGPTARSVDSILKKLDAPDQPRPRNRAEAEAANARWRAVMDSMERAGEVMWPAVRGQVRLTLHSDGRVSGVTLTRPSVLVALDSALGVAVRTSGEARALAGLVPMGSAGADSVEVVLTLVSDAALDGVSAPLVAVRLPHYRLTPALLLPGGPHPRYPDAARSHGREGRVVVDFELTTDGTVDLRSLRALHGSDEFVASVVAALARMPFRPARLGDCAVRVELRQPFEFALQR